MADLSPQAQAVLIAQAKVRCLSEWSALNDPPCHPNDPEWNGCIQCIDRCGIAAALRVVADFEIQSPWPTSIEGCGARWMRDRILAIAAELEAKQ